MKRIAFVAAFPPPISGQSLAARLLSDGLSCDGVQIFELDLCKPLGGEPLMKRLFQLASVEAGLLYLCVRHRDLIVYIQLGHGKSAMIRDIVFMLTSMFTRHPCFGHVHGSGFREAFDRLPAPLRYIERRCIRKLSAVAVLSQSLRTMFQDLLDDDRIFAVDNGIDPDFVAMTQDRKPSCVRDRPNILFLSNLLTDKGFSTLLETARLAKNEHRSWIFTFVGHKVDNQDVDIDEYIETFELDNVVVRDVVRGKDKHLAYSNADIFVLPSIYEGQPLCILEAMFESLPVITTKVGGIPEIFSDTTGVRYVSPNDPTELYESIRSILSDPERMHRMGQANRLLALSRFTAVKHISRMKDLLFSQFTSDCESPHLPKRPIVQTAPK